MFSMEKASLKMISRFAQRSCDVLMQGHYEILAQTFPYELQQMLPPIPGFHDDNANEPIFPKYKYYVALLALSDYCDGGESLNSVAGRNSPVLYLAPA